MSATRALEAVGVVYPSDAEVARWRELGAWPDLTLGDALRGCASLFPDKTVIIADGRTLTMREFDELTERYAAALVQQGLTPGNRALFQMGNCVETFLCLAACLKAGVVPVCSLPQHREHEIGQLARLSEPRAYFVQGDLGAFDLVAFAERMRADWSSVRLLVAERSERRDVPSLGTLAASISLDEARATLVDVEVRSDDVAVFQLSGGTTGVPKIIPRFHGEYLAHSLSWADAAGVDGDATILWNLPVIHNAGMQWAFVPTLALGRAVVLQARIDVDAMLEAVELHGVTHALSIGPIAPLILARDDLGRFDLSSLRSFGTLSRAEALERHLGVPAYNIFGITEGILTCSRPEHDVARRHGTCGLPTRPLESVRLVHPGTERDVEPGEVGELCFKGPSTLRAYVRAAEGAASFTVDGHFRTGDLMRAHGTRGAGGLSFEGRLKDNIDRGGEKFGAEEVEALICDHPDVMGAAVVAMPCPVMGERACAFLIPRPGAAAPDVAGLGAFLLGCGLAKFKLPERIEQIAEFPTTRAGKLDKAALREMIRAALAREQAALAN